jgi:putative membrane protein
MRLRLSEWGVLVFTVLYVTGFGLYFVAIGNREFLWYVATLVFFMALITATLKASRFPPAILWALALWGLAHMAGGGLRVGDGVLYAYQVLPIAGDGEMTLLKFDQVVHFYGFAVTTFVLWHLLRRHFPALAGSKTLYVYPALGSMGLGALNEIIEFVAVVSFPETGVGGYYNTALDLVFNGLGACAAAALIFLRGRFDDRSLAADRTTGATSPRSRPRS